MNLKLDKQMEAEVRQIANDMRLTYDSKDWTPDMRREQHDRNRTAIIESCAERDLAFHPYVDLYKREVER